VINLARAGKGKSMRLKVSINRRRLLITLLAEGLGNLLAYLSALLISVPQVAFDLSHLATFAVVTSSGRIMDY
jgi:hypothetical protein